MEINVYKPYESDWLTPKEVERARLLVHELKDHWRPTVDTLLKLGQFGTVHSEDIQMYTLGRATYLSKRMDPTISEYNEFMHHHFDWLFDRAIVKLKEVFNIDDISIAENVTTPGFHIFQGPSGEVEPPNYHRDISINYIIPDAPDDNWMHSFGCLLQNVSDPPAHLDYKYEESHGKMTYTIGKMNFWNSYMPHRVGGCNSIGEDEFRITFQGHIAKINGEYKIYF